METKKLSIDIVAIPAVALIQKSAKGRCIPNRYIITLLCFICCFVMTCQRLNLGMGLVAMVNHTAIRQTSHSNSTECAAHYITEDPNVEAFHESHNTGTFEWDAETQGQIVSANFLGFMLTQIPGGRLGERLGPRQVLVFSLIFAALCTIFSPYASYCGAYYFLGLQFFRGIAHGFQHPAISCLLSHWVPSTENGFIPSFVFSGYTGGSVIGGVICGILCDSTFLGGWPSTFYVFGLMGLVLAVAFIYLSPNYPEEDHTISEIELKYILSDREVEDKTKKISIPWKSMMLSAPTWALLIGMFGQYWMTLYFVSIHPTYLGAILHFTHTENGYLNSFPYLGQMACTYLASYVSDVLVKKKLASVDTVRKYCNTLACIGFSLALIGISFSGCDHMLNTIFFVIAVASVGVGFPGSCTAVLDMTVTFAGTLFGIGGTIASTSGFIAPLIVGALTMEQTLEEWQISFYVSVAVVLASGAVFHIFGSAKIQDWDTPRSNESNKEGVVNEAYDANLDIKHSIKSIPFRRESRPSLQYVVVERF